MDRYDVANEANSLPSCDRFGTFADFAESDAGCAVCGHLELSHAAPGRRALGTSEILVLRESLIAASALVYGAD